MGKKDIEIWPALCMFFLRMEKCFWSALGLRGSNGTCKVSADTQFAGDAAKSTSVLTNAKQSLQIERSSLRFEMSMAGSYCLYLTFSLRINVVI